MIKYFDVTDSTNNRCMEIGTADGEEFSIVIAGKQTAGRGRNGHIWESEDVGGLYFSILLRPNMEISKISMMTLVMAYSISRFARERNIECQIKWPNDIVVNGKKICGILTEMRYIPQNNEYFIVIGIGLNIGNKKFNSEWQDSATSVFLETGNDWTDGCKDGKIGLVKQITEYFKEDYLSVVSAGTLNPILEQYEKLLLNKGADVIIKEKNGETQAKALGITPYGELIVERNNGELINISSGEVSIRSKNGYAE